jgi:hypothetical protein
VHRFGFSCTQEDDRWGQAARRRRPGQQWLIAQGGRSPEHARPEWAKAGPAMKNPRKTENGMPMRFGPKSELSCIFDFEFYFKDLSLKSKVSNTFKPNLN